MAPRYSIVAGDFAEDQRADVSHFRVYLIVGRHTDKAGWCRLKQITISERIGLSRETVNRKLKDLCKWGYVEKRPHDAKGKSGGRSFWYRTIMDRGVPPSDLGPDDDPNEDAGNDSDELNPEAMRGLHGSFDENSNVTHASHAEYNSGIECDGGVTAGVSAADHSRCDRTPSHYNDPSLTALSNEKKESPPLPPAGGRVRAKRLSEIEGALRDLTDDTTTSSAWRFALTEVLSPIVTQRRFDAPVIASALRSLAQFVADQGLTKAEASAIVKKILEERRASVKPSDIADATKQAVNMRPPPRLLKGNAELMREWPRVLATLERILGPATAQQAFSTLVIDRLDRARGGRVIAYVSTHEPWRKKSIELSLSAQFRAALSAVFPGVTEFFIEHRRTAA